MEPTFWKYYAPLLRKKVSRFQWWLFPMGDFPMWNEGMKFRFYHLSYKMVKTFDVFTPVCYVYLSGLKLNLRSKQPKQHKPHRMARFSGSTSNENIVTIWILTVPLHLHFCTLFQKPTLFSRYRIELRKWSIFNLSTKRQILVSSLGEEETTLHWKLKGLWSLVSALKICTSANQ